MPRINTDSMNGVAQEILKQPQELSVEDAVVQAEARSDSAAAAGMEAFDARLQRYEPIGRELFGGISAPQFLGLELPFEKVMNNTRSLVQNVLERSSVQYQNELGTTAHRVEDQLKLIKYRASRERTVDAVRHMKMNRDVSAGIAEDQLGVMQSSLGMIEQELAERERLGIMMLEQRPWIKQKLGLWRMKRFKKVMKTMRDKFEKEKTRMLDRLEMVQGYAKQSTKLAETRISSLMKTADRNQKEQISTALIGLFEGRNDVGLVMQAFGLARNRFSHAQFLDALESEGILDRIKEVQESAGLYRNAEENLKVAQQREDQFEERLTNFDFEAFEQVIQTHFSVLPSKETVTAEDLAYKLSVEFKKDQNMFGHINYQQGINTPEEVLLYGFEALSLMSMADVSKFPRDLMRDILKYLGDMREGIGGDLDLQLTADLDTAAQETLTEMKWLVNKDGAMPAGYEADSSLPDLCAALSAPNGTDTVDVANRVFVGYDRFMEKRKRVKAAYESQKKKLTPDDLERLDDVWGEMDRVYEKVSEKIKIWEKEVKSYRDLIMDTPDSADPEGSMQDAIDALTRNIQDQSDIMSTNESMIDPTVGGNGNQRSKKIKNDVYYDAKAEKERLQRELGKVEGKFGALRKHSFTSPGYFDADVLGIRDVNFTPTGLPAPNATAGISNGIDRRQFRNSLRKEFLARLDKEYLSGLEQNMDRQWEFLQHAPEGTLIHLNYCDITGMMSLPNPNDLADKSNTPDIGKSLRLVRKTDKGIVFEGNSHIIVMTGGSVKNGVPQTNLALFEKQAPVGGTSKTRKMSSGSRTGGVGTANPLNYLQASSQPNMHGIALGIQMLS